MNCRRAILGCGLALAGLASCGPRSAPGPPGHLDPGRPPPGITFGPGLPPDKVVDSGTVYVPIYSSIASADTGRPINLAATLTIRNLDRERRLEVRSVRYHDASGRLVRDHLARPAQLAPLAALNLFVGESDDSGGTSPSFLVEWGAAERVTPPLVEAVMVSTAGAQGIAFTSTGRAIVGRGQ